VPAGLVLHATSAVPVARGLGSSAAAMVAGALAADALLGLGLGARGVAALVATAEGHPDNAAPCALGGAVLGAPDGGATGGWTFAALPVHPDVEIALAVPAFETSTRVMRAALPPTLPYADAVRTAGKAAALVHGLAAGDGALLAHALDDVLHVPYRRALLPGYDAVVAAARAAGAWGATISGAGSSLLALAPRGRVAAVADAMAHAWRAAGQAAEGCTPAIAAGATVARTG
jgi:homoserine kinase